MVDIKDLKSKFTAAYGENDKEIMGFFSPGRVNLIGEHIDYNGGFVFPAALSIGIYGMMRYREDDIITLKSINAKNDVIFNIGCEIGYTAEDSWGNYPKGVARYLSKEGYTLRGADILYYGNLPNGAGLSSSAALEVLTAYMLTYNNEKAADRVFISKLSQKVENEFIGVNCGIMDQFSVAMGKKDNAMLLDCNELSYRYAPIVLNDKSIVLINTNKRRELADSKYNERRTECEKALEILRKHKQLDNLCQAEAADINQYITDDTLKRRAKHVVLENQRVLKAVEVLEQGRLEEFGRLMVESHMSLKYDYEVTGSELDAIVEEALKVEGCIGCRMTGAGFGGCAVAIVENSRLEEFKAKVLEGYKSKTGLTPDFYVCVIGDGVSRIDI